MSLLTPRFLSSLNSVAKLGLFHLKRNLYSTAIIIFNQCFLAPLFYNFNNGNKIIPISKMKSNLNSTAIIIFNKYFEILAVTL